MDNKKVIIAGAGHGGLVAAAHLSANGFDVTVIERFAQGTLGYDWTDMFEKDCFDFCGIELPKNANYVKVPESVFVSPNKKTKIKTEVLSPITNVNMDRSAIYDSLIGFALEKGVKFEYETKIISPIVENNRVTGIFVEKNGKKETRKADLIIDAAGAFSPVRSLLPSNLMIENEFDNTQVFETFRAFYERDMTVTPPDTDWNVYFFHLDKPGISWYECREEYCDVLIGRFNKFGEQDIKQVIDDFKNEHPELTDKIIRGGQFAFIPARRAVGKMVADGYAAVGDSAAMTVALIGSGIANSMIAGKMLADVVIENNGKTDVKTLWKYNVRYFKEINADICSLDKLREMLCTLGTDNLNFLLNKGVVKGEDITAAIKEGGIKLGIKDLIEKATKGISDIPLLLKVMKTLNEGEKLSKIALSIPEEYDENKVKMWLSEYNC